jgi:acetoin utilization protein AcuC
MGRLHEGAQALESPVEAEVAHRHSAPGRRAALIGSELFDRPGFHLGHPLGIARVDAVMRLCRALGWIGEGEYWCCPAASFEELTRFHSPDYVRALRAADAAGCVSIEMRERFHIGTSENPLFPGVYARAATTVGGAILAARLALEGCVSFHPGGGTHHGRRDRASGFCYFNDPVFALRELTGQGLERVLYVDFDAHHGDGVQDALRDDERIHMMSIHEMNRWPHTGDANDHGGGRAMNYPVPGGFNDAELDYLMDNAVLPRIRRLQPQAAVIVCGADALAGDPLSGLLLSNLALWRAVEAVVALVPAVVVLGGGGYNPWTLARCWAGLWARLSGRAIPARAPASAQCVLQGLACELIEDDEIEPAWLTTIADAPRQGFIRQSIRDLAAQVRFA